jgi:hypothetical protein
MFGSSCAQLQQRATAATQPTVQTESKVNTWQEVDQLHSTTLVSRALAHQQRGGPTQLQFGMAQTGQ